MSKLLSKISAMIAVFVLSLAVLVPVGVSAQTAADICEGVGITTGQDGCEQPEDSPSVQGIVRLVINILSMVVGVIAVIMIIIGGLKYITSGGDSGSVTSAKNTILYAIIGLVIVALSQVIVRFVLTEVQTSGEDTTSITLPVSRVS